MCSDLGWRVVCVNERSSGTQDTKRSAEDAGGLLTHHHHPSHKAANASHRGDRSPCNTQRLTGNKATPLEWRGRRISEQETGRMHMLIPRECTTSEVLRGICTILDLKEKKESVNECVGRAYGSFREY